MTTSTTTMRRPLLLVGLAYAAFISLGLPDGLTSVAWPSVRATFRLPLDALGALLTTATIGYLISSFSSGRLLARIGVGWLLVLSCVATAFSLFGYGLTPAWILMVGLGFLAGLGGGAIDAGLNTYAAEQFSPRTVNWLHASFGLGAATGPLIMTGVISAGQPWRLGYLLVGGAQMLLAGCFLLTRRQWDAPVSATETQPNISAAITQTLRLPTAWLSILLFFFYTGVEFTAGQWLYTLLTESRGLATGIAGIWVSMYWGSLTVGRLLSGIIITRITVLVLLRLCMGGMLIGIVLLWFGITAWMQLVGISLLGLSLAPMFPSFISLTPGRMGAAHAANTIGFQVAAAAFGGATLASGFGILADRLGLELLGPILLIEGLLLIIVFQILEHKPRKS